MCGRFTLTVPEEELMIRFAIDQVAAKYQPRYNVAPMQMVMAVINDGEKNRLGELRWGLVPNWAKDEKLAANMINARVETLLEKPAFKSLVKQKRCILPADGMAEIYDTWTKPDGSKVSTCAIITTSPNELMEPIHDRMPVILRPEDEQAWLDRNNQHVMGLLRPYSADEMQAYPVSPKVGNVKNNDEECIVEVYG